MSHTLHPPPVCQLAAAMASMENLSPRGKATNGERHHTRITIASGGGPTDDKPGVTLEPPSDPNRVSAFRNVRVADIHKVY